MKISEAIVGAKAGRLTITNILDDRNKHGKLVAECICDCGKKITAVINNIGVKTNSCGCFRAEDINRRMGHDAKTNSAAKVLIDLKRRTSDTNLTIQAVIDLIFSNCFYCEKSPNEVGTEKVFKISEEKAIHIGIDRINNDIGYYINNVNSCCYDCNMIKRDSSIDHILQYFPIISANADKLSNGPKPIPCLNQSFAIEHIDNCQCYTNSKYFTTLESRGCKLARMKLKSRGHFSLLSLEDIHSLIYAPCCFYCERPIKDVGGLYKRNEYGDNLCSIRALGIDRIDSNGGYTIGNTIQCCKDCNYIKREYSVDHFSLTTKNIYDKILWLVKDNKIHYLENKA